MVLAKLCLAEFLLPFFFVCNASQWQGNATTSLLPFPSDSCAINAWPTGQEGEPYAPQAPDAELTSMLNEIDPVRIEAIIEKLVSFGKQPRRFWLISGRVSRSSPSYEKLMAS